VGEDRGSSRRRRAPTSVRKRERWRRRWRLGVAAGLTGLCALAAPATRAATPAAAATAAADQWQSCSYDGFWAMDRPLADPGAFYADSQVVVYGTSARQCILSSCSTYWVPRCVGAAVASMAEGPFLPLTTALVCGSPG